MNATNSTVQRGSTVRTWDGHIGEVLYITTSGWYGVRLTGEKRVDHWQRFQLEAVAS